MSSPEVVTSSLRPDSSQTNQVRRQLVLASAMAPALASATAALLAGCAARTPMRIGFIGGLSGRIADLGIGARNGAQMAVDELNAQGGLAGRTLELLPRDDEQNAEIARQRLSELFAAGVELVIGPVTSTMVQPLLPLANERRIPLISPLAGANDFSGRDDAFFRVVSDTARSAAQHANALLARGLRRIVAVGDARNAVFTRNWIRSLGATFVAGGGSVVETIEFEAAPGLRFLDLAQRIAALSADGVAIVASAADSAVLVQQLRRIRPGLPVGLSAWAGTEELPQLGGASLDGVLVTQFFDRFNTTPRWQDFVTRYRQRFGDAPGYPAMNGHDAVTMAAAAVRSGTDDGLLAALRRLRAFDGLQRKLRFDEFGDCLVTTYLTEVRDGRYVAVDT